MKISPREADTLIASTCYKRPIYWIELGEFVETPVWEIEHEEWVAPLEGPALVQLPDTVIVIRPGQSTRMDAFGNFIIEIAA